MDWTTPGGSGEHRRIVLHVELRWQPERDLNRHRVHRDDGRRLTGQRRSFRPLGWNTGAGLLTTGQEDGEQRAGISWTHLPPPYPEPPARPSEQLDRARSPVTVSTLAYAAICGFKRP